MDSLYGVQPFEELANNEPEPTSPTSLEEFYKEEERKDLERRLSRRALRRRRGRSKSLASSIGGPLSPGEEQPSSLLRTNDPSLPPVLENTVPSDGATPPNPTANTPNGGTPNAGISTPSGGSVNEKGGSAQNTPEMKPMQWHEPQREYFPPEAIPKPYYEIHNQIIPPIPWTNHHLRPPGTPWPPTSQPRKVFVPPTTANSTSLIHQVNNSGSFTNSSSSVTKSSSATNLAPPAIYGPDHVDNLDPSDPWGMRWHHDSRYDVGDFTSSTRGNPVLATWAGTSSPAVDLPRRRNGSPSGSQPGPGNPHRQGVKSPSPLSQSTSANSIQAHGPLKAGSSISLDTPKQLSRRLSKRNSRNIHTQPGPSAFDQPAGESGSATKRVSGFRSLFTSSLSAPLPGRQRRVTLSGISAPPAPATLSRSGKAQTLNAPPPTGATSRSSLTPSPTGDLLGNNGTNSNGGKRVSYLERLVKKFSIIKHHPDPGENLGRRGDRSPGGGAQRTPPNSAGPVAGGRLKRSASHASGFLSKSAEVDGTGHPRFASAPADTVLSPISMVPELRLVGVQEGPDGAEPNGIGSPLSPIDPAMHRQREQQQRQQQTRPMSDERGSPELQVSRLQYGGLVITNPDVRASAASVTEDEEKEGMSEYGGSLGNRIRKADLSPSATSPWPTDLPAPPRPAFMLGAGGIGGGGASSTESSPVVDHTPLRVVNLNGREETETETETEGNGGGKGLRNIPSPRSPATTLPPLPSPRRTLYSENGSHHQLLLSAIPSIPDLPAVSPLRPARSLNGGETTDSPRSESMETALEFLSPPVSSLSINHLTRSSSRAPSGTNLSKPESSSSSVGNGNGSPARKPSPDQRQQQQQQRPMSITSSGTTKASSVAASIPASTSSTSTSTTTITSTKFPTTNLSPVPTSVSSTKPPANSPEYEYETAAPPPVRRRAPSSTATVTGSDGFGGGSRYAAYYSPGTFPTLALPPGTPQQQPGSQRHSFLSTSSSVVESNPLPAPPARLLMPQLSESGSQERLRTKEGSGTERLSWLSGTTKPAERQRTKSQGASVEREKVEPVPVSKEQRLAAQKSKETIRDVRDSRSSGAGRYEPPSNASSSSSRATTIVDPAVSSYSTAPTFDKPASKEKRGDREERAYGRDREAEVVKERRNQSTFRIPGEPDSKPISRDPPGASTTTAASASVAGTGSIVRERSRSQPKEVAPTATNANANRSRVESGSYDVTLSRPSAKHSSSYQSVSSSFKGSEVEAESRKKRTDSPAGSENQRNEPVVAPSGSSGREDAKRRANSTRGTNSALNSSRAATVDSAYLANGKQSSKPESRTREEPNQEDPSKLVIAGLGQNWEVVEAVMIQPHRSSSSSAAAKRPQPISKESVSSASANSSSRPTSNGTSYPARTSSRPGYNAAGEPIPPTGPPPRVSNSSRRGTSTSTSTREQPQYTTSPTREMTMSPTREGDRSARSSQYDRERTKTVDSAPAPARPIVPSKSRSRMREGSLPANVNLNKPQPPRPPPTPATEQQPLPNSSREYPPRRDSFQRMRPTSEVVNIPELGAQEAWEHERMTGRGQSVLLPDGFSVSPPTSHRASAGSSVLLQGQTGSGSNGPAPGAGSAHTIFKVQPPFQARTAPPGGYYYPNHQPVPNPLPAPPAIVPPKTTRNWI